jgi:hypothetical protein
MFTEHNLNYMYDYTILQQYNFLYVKHSLSVYKLCITNKKYIPKPVMVQYPYLK